MMAARWRNACILIVSLSGCDAEPGGQRPPADTGVEDAQLHDAQIQDARPQDARPQDARLQDTSLEDARLQDTAVDATPDATADQAHDAGADLADAFLSDDAADPWPDPAPPIDADISLVYAGRAIALDEALRITAAPAGLDQATDIELILTNRSAEPLALAPDGWLNAPVLSWIEPPPARLQPNESVRLQLRFDSAAHTEAERVEARLQVPSAGAERALTVLIDVPPPLRMVVVGTGNTTWISDSYGAAFDAAPALPDPSGREQITWGGGLFFRSWSDGTEWESPGRYAYSPDGVDWVESMVSDGFWAANCAYGLDQFTCASVNDLLWSNTGVTVIREGHGWAPYLHDFAFGDDRFVAVGRETRRIVSLDGRTWAHEVRDDANDNFNAVAYAGDGHWIAAGGRNRLYVSTSADGGETWTPWIEPNAGQAERVHCGPTRCLMTTRGPNDRLWASDDRGRTWQALPNPMPVTHEVLGWVNGWFFAAINAWQTPGVVLRSRDGVAWAVVHEMADPTHVRALAVEGWRAPPPGASVGAIVSVDAPDINPAADPPVPPCMLALEATVDDAPVGAALHLGETPAGGAAIAAQIQLTNPCGVPVHFLGHPLEWLDGDGFELAELPPVRLAPGAEASLTVRFAPGPAGEAEGRLVLPYDQPSGPFELDLSATVGPPLTVVFVGDGGHRIATPDYGESIALDTFATLEGHGDTLQRGVCWGRGRFVSVGGNVDRRWWTSADGIEWSAHQMPGGPLSGCAYGDGRFVAMDGYPMFSVDGEMWQLGERGAFNPDHLRAIAYGAGRFVAVGDNGRVSVTADGSRWLHTRNLEAVGASLGAIAWGNDTFIAVGEAGWVARSIDGGGTWQTQQIGQDRWEGVAYVDDRFLIGDGTRIMASDDGIIWNPVNASPVIPRVGVGRQAFGSRARSIYRSADGGFSWALLHTSPEGLGLSHAAAEGHDHE